jgi:hypothetical protein
MEELSAYRLVGKPFLSRGHFAGRWQVQISANDLARTAYVELRPTTRFAPGAILVKVHVDARSGSSGPVFARIKKEAGYFPEGNDWEYVVADSAGSVEQRGPLPLCANCHADGLGDATFAPPQDAR